MGALLSVTVSLLLSGVARAEPPTAAEWRPSLDQPLPMVRADAALGMVVLTVGAPAAWGQPDRLVLAPRGDRAAGHYAIAGVVATGLPPELAAVRGRAITVHTPAGRCAGTVGELMVVSRQSWMEGYAGWTYPEGSCAAWDAACDAHILKETLEMSGERLLVGVVAGCAVGFEDTVATLGGASVAWGVTDAPETVRHTEAMARLRTTAPWQEAQAGWVASGDRDEASGSSAQWGESPRVATFTVGKRTFVTATDEMGGCGYYSASVWAAWELVARRGRTAWRPVPTPKTLTSFDASVAFDRGGEGLPTFLNGWRAVAPSGGGLVEAARFEEPWIGCGC